MVLHVKVGSLKVFCEHPTTASALGLLRQSLCGAQASFKLMIHCYCDIREGLPHWALKLLSSNRTLHTENSTLSPSDEVQPENNSAFKRLLNIFYRTHAKLYDKNINEFCACHPKVAH